MELLVYELQLKLMLQEISFSEIIGIFEDKMDGERSIRLKGSLESNRRRV